MKKVFAVILFLVSGLVTKFSAQCQADFIYTVGANGSVTFSSTSVGTSSTTAYYWNFDDGANMTAYGTPTVSHVYSYNQVFNVSLNINDSINNQSCWSSVTKTVSVSNSSCSGSLSFSPYEGSNGYVTFNNTSIGISPLATYTFFFGDGSIITTNQSSAGHTYSAAGVYNASFIASGAGCTYTAAQTVTVNYNICPLNASFTYSVGTNGLVTFSSTSAGTTSLTNYFWNFGDGNSNGFTQNTGVSNQYLQSGTYNVHMMIADSFNTSCFDTITQAITLNNVCFASSSFIMWKDSSMVPSIVYNAYPTYPANIQTAEWNWGDGSTTVGLYPSHTFSATGVYNICLSVTVTCGSTTTTCSSSNIFRQNAAAMQMASVNVVNTPPTGVIKNSNAISADIYPNPSDGKYIIDVKGVNTDIKVEIYSLLGEMVYSSTFTTGVQQSIDISEKGPGYYFMKITSGNRTINKKIVVRR